MYGPDLRGPWIYACPGTVTRAKPRPGQRGTEDKSALGSHENELWDLQDALDGSGEAGRRHGERMLDIRPETTFFWVILRPCNNYHKAYAWQWVEIYQKYLEGRNAADQYCNELTKLLLYPREQLYVLWRVCHNHACGLLMFPHRRNRGSLDPHSSVWPLLPVTSRQFGLNCMRCTEETSVHRLGRTGQDRAGGSTYAATESILGEDLAVQLLWGHPCSVNKPDGLTGSPGQSVVDLYFSLCWDLRTIV